MADTVKGQESVEKRLDMLNEKLKNLTQLERIETLLFLLMRDKYDRDVNQH